MEIIGSRLCRNCSRSHVPEDTGIRQCRLYPPVEHGVVRPIAMMKEGKPVLDERGAPVVASQTAGFESRYPRVADDWWCAQHSGLVVK